MSHRYRETTPVVLTEAEKRLESDVFRLRCRGYPVKRLFFRRGIFSPNHDVLEVSFATEFEKKSTHFTVEIIPTKIYPYEEPAALLITPDIADLPTKTAPNIYQDFEGRLLCAHVTEWTPRTTMAEFFTEAVYPWAMNFTAWLHENDLTAAGAGRNLAEGRDASRKQAQQMVSQ